MNIREVEQLHKLGLVDWITWESPNCTMLNLAALNLNEYSYPCPFFLAFTFSAQLGSILTTHCIYAGLGQCQSTHSTSPELWGNAYEMDWVRCCVRATSAEICSTKKNFGSTKF